ncbi:MAG: hypothetical protein JWP80_5099 [Pseudomonas sp.]|nr:hypothetical protein [Pseudomonas sp.]
MKSVVFIFLTFMLGAISATALAMPCAQAHRYAGDVHDSQHVMRLFVAQVGTEQSMQV